MKSNLVVSACSSSLLRNIINELCVKERLDNVYNYLGAPFPPLLSLIYIY